MQVVVEGGAWFAILYGSLVLSTKTGALMFRKDDLSFPAFSRLIHCSVVIWRGGMGALER